jgi:hypothetical protein
MSHVITTHFFIHDLESLALAAKRLGGELAIGSKRYQWFGRHVGDYKLPEGRTKEQMGTCEHEIRFKGCGYSVGVIKRADGQPGYDLEYDFYAGGRGLTSVIGENANHLRQAYSVVRAKRAIAAQGHKPIETKLSSGQVQLSYAVQ